MNFDRDLLQAARREWHLLGLTILLGVAGGIAVILQARQLSSILAAVFIGGQTSDSIAWMFPPILLILAGRALVSWGADAAAGHLAVTVKENLRSLLVNRLFRLGPAYTRSENSGELTNTAIQGVEALDAYFSLYLPQVVLAGLVPLTILVAVFPVDWLSGLILVLTAPLIPIFMVLIGKAAEAATKRQWHALSRLSAYFLDTLQGLRELKLLGQSQRQVERVGQASDQYRLTTMTVLRVTFLSALVLEIVGTISTAVIAVQIGLRLLHGELIFEQAFFILLLAPEFYQPLRLLGQRFHAGANGIQAARRIFTILNTTGLSEPPDLGLSPEKPGSPPSLIQFEHVTYTYPGQTHLAVAAINFQLRRGQMTALVGATGAGKSTIANLLMRFMLPTVGQILVDGVSLNSIPSSFWHRQVAWVPQHPVIFQKSIAENIALGNPDAQLAEIQAAAQMALLHERILSLPAGYDTILGEEGAHLSGGELQRLALARAFLLDAPLLVLDEPTAHLDLNQESLLEATVQRLCARRTVLVIAHRLPTVIRADQILVMEHGSIVESGSHQSLSAANKFYTRLLQVYRGVQA